MNATSGAGYAAEPDDSGRWLVALDLDGTTVDPDNVASQRVFDAVHAAVAAGDVVIASTGRPVAGVLPVYQELQLQAPFAVCSNGAVVVGLDGTEDEANVKSGDFNVVDITTFDPAPVIDRISQFLPEGRYAVEDGTNGYRFDRPFLAGTFGAPSALVSLDDLKSRRVTRVIVVSPGQDVHEFERLVELIGLHQVSYSMGWTAWLDIAPLGVNKATALEQVRLRLGIPRDRVLAVGDGYNDVEMLEWAAEQGIGAAMGHSDPSVQRHANRVVGDLEHDGVADALDLIAATRR